MVGAERGGGWAPWRPAKAVEEPVEAFVLTLSAEGRSGGDVERWREGRAEREGCTRRERRERREHVAEGEGHIDARREGAVRVLGECGGRWGGDARDGGSVIVAWRRRRRRRRRRG